MLEGGPIADVKEAGFMNRNFFYFIFFKSVLVRAPRRSRNEENSHFISYSEKKKKSAKADGR